MTRNERKENEKNEEETKSRPTKKVSHITNAKMSSRRTRTRGGEGEGEGEGDRRRRSRRRSSSPDVKGEKKRKKVKKEEETNGEEENKTNPEDSDSKRGHQHLHLHQQQKRHNNNNNGFTVTVPNKRVVSIVYPGYDCMNHIPEIIEKFGGKGQLMKACEIGKRESATVTNTRATVTRMMMDGKSSDGGGGGGGKDENKDDGLVSTGMKALEMKFREKDALALPIYGEKLDAKTLVLRVFKSSSSSSGKNSNTKKSVQVEAFARCTKQIEFRGLADFQYCSTLTEREEEEELRKKMKTRKRIFASDESMNRRKSSRVEDKMEFVVNEDEIRAPTGDAEDPFMLRLKSKAMSRNKESRGIEGKKENEVKKLVVPGEFKLVPPVYCKEDVPVDYFEDGETRKYREELTFMPQGNNEILVDFADATVPQVLPRNVEADEQRPVWYKKLVKLFKERPVWSPRGLQEKLRSIVPANISVDAKQTRAELREMAYKFNNGPFRKLWILRGFDPRLSKNNVRYQLYEIKLPNSWYNKKDSTLFPKVQKSIQQSRTHLDYHEFRALPKTRFPIFFMDDVILPSVKREFRMIAENKDVKDDDKDDATGVYAHGQTEYGPDGTAIISGCSEKFGFLSRQARTTISERIGIAYLNVLNGKDPIAEDNVWVQAEEKIHAAKQKRLKEKEQLAEEEALAIAAALATGRQRNRKKQKKPEVELTIRNSTAPIHVTSTNIPTYLGPGGSNVMALSPGEDGFAALNAILERKMREAPTKTTEKEQTPTLESQQTDMEEENAEKGKYSGEGDKEEAKEEEEEEEEEEEKEEEKKEEEEEEEEEPPVVAEEEEAFEIFDSD
jgi:hypothetical protein